MSEEIDLEAQRHVATISALNLACGLTMAVFAGLMLFAILGATEDAERTYYLFASIFFALLGAVNGILWRGLNQLSPTARLIQLAVGVVSLAGFPLGTAWGVYVLWALLRPRGRRLFSLPYRRARLDEPVVVRPYAWVVGIGVVVGLLVAVGGLLAASHELSMLLETQGF